MASPSPETVGSNLAATSAAQPPGDEAQQILAAFRAKYQGAYDKTSDIDLARGIMAKYPGAYEERLASITKPPGISGIDDILRQTGAGLLSTVGSIGNIGIEVNRGLGLPAPEPPTEEQAGQAVGAPQPISWGERVARGTGAIAPLAAAAGPATVAAGVGEIASSFLGAAANDFAAKVSNNPIVQALISSGLMIAGVKLSPLKIGVNARAKLDAAGAQAAKDMVETHIPALDERLRGLQQAQLGNDPINVARAEEAARSAADNEAASREAAQPTQTISDYLLAEHLTAKNANIAQPYGGPTTPGDVSTYKQGQLATQRIETIGGLQDLRSKLAKHFGVNYDAVYDPVRDTPLDPLLVQKHLLGSENPDPTSGISPGVEGAFADAKKWTSQIPAPLNAIRAKVAAMAGAPLDTAAPGGDIVQRTPQTQAAIDKAQAWVEALKKTQPPTIGDLLALRGDVRPFLDTKFGTIGHLANDIDSSIRDTLEAHAVPKNVPLNQDYITRQKQDRILRGVLSKAVSPEDLGSIMKSDQLAPLWQQATTPEEQQIVRTNVARWAGSKPNGMNELTHPDMQAMTEHLWPGSIKAAAMEQLKKAAPDLETLRDQSPAANKAFGDRMAQAWQNSKAMYEPQARKAIVDTLKTVGQTEDADHLMTQQPAAALHYYDTTMQDPQFADLIAADARMKSLGQMKAASQMPWRAKFIYGPMGAVSLASGHIGFGATALGLYGARTAYGSVERALVNSLENPSQYRRIVDYVTSGQPQAALKVLGKRAGQLAAFRAAQRASQ